MRLHLRVATLVCAGLSSLLLALSSRRVELVARSPVFFGHGSIGQIPSFSPWWAATNGSSSSQRTTPYVCGHCVIDPLVYPDSYCAPMESSTFNMSVQVQPTLKVLETLEQYEDLDRAALLQLLDALAAGGSAGSSSTIGVLGDSFTQQSLDAIACEARRLGVPERAAFMKWDVVLGAAGQFNEDMRPQRYNWAGPHGPAAAGRDGPRWFVLSQMYFNAREVGKLLEASDVAIINYGLHYCQPVRIGADDRCREQFGRYESEMRSLLRMLQDFVASSGGSKVAVLMETSAQHFPAAKGVSTTGDWELREWFPRPGPTPPATCQCAPTASSAAAPSAMSATASSATSLPLRTQLLRNLSGQYPGVRLMRLHDLLAPRYGWHQQDCKEQELVRWRPRAQSTRGTLARQVVHGCDCTHYCYSPSFWRRYFHVLRGHIVAGREWRPST